MQPEYDLEAQQPRPAREWSRSLKETISNVTKKHHPDADSLVQDLSAIASTATAFGSSINSYAFQSDQAQRGFDIANAITSLGTTAFEGVRAYQAGEVKHPYYAMANVASFALAVGRTAVDLAMDAGSSKETAKFAIDVAQTAMQVAKWGTKPSAKKAKGVDYDGLASELSSLRSEVDSARSAIAASSTSVHTTRSAPAAGGAHQRVSAVQAGKRRASR